MASRHRLLLDGVEHEVVIDDQGDVLVVTVDDGEAVTVDVTNSGLPGLFSMLIDGEPRRAYVSRAGAGFAVTVGSRRFEVLPASGAGRKRGAVGHEDEPGKITAPLAGVVVEVRVSVGDRVERGQTVAVVEAMKMQNEVQCPQAGTITAIHAEAGARTERDALLVEYEPDEE